MSWLKDVWNILFMCKRSDSCVKDLFNEWKIVFMCETSYLCVKRLIYAWKILLMCERSYLCVKDFIYIHVLYTEILTVQKQGRREDAKRLIYVWDDSLNYRSLLQKSPIKETISAKETYDSKEPANRSHPIRSNPHAPYTAILTVQKQGQRQDVKRLRLIYVWNDSFMYKVYIHSNSHCPEARTAPRRKKTHVLLKWLMSVQKYIYTAILIVVFVQISVSLSLSLSSSLSLSL